MGTIQVASSSRLGAELAVADVRNQLNAEPLSLVLAFCCPRQDPDAVAQILRQQLPAHTHVLGCTTAGEIGPKGYQSDTLVVLALPADEFIVSVCALTDLRALESTQWQTALDGARIEVENGELSPGAEANRFAIVLVDGLSRYEEVVGQAVRRLVPDMPLVGASAGDGLAFERAPVICQGQAIDNAAVVALVRTTRPLEVLQCQHFEMTDTRMAITGARPAERIVTEINGYPAAEEYARLTGLDSQALDAMSFAAFPLVVRNGEGEYVRSIQQVNADGSLTFFCAIDEGVVLRLVRSTDPRRDLATRLGELAGRLGRVDRALTFDCILRRIEFKRSLCMDAISDLLRQHRCVGFSSYGELLNGIHLNQTMTVLALGEPRPAEVVS